MGVPVLNGNLFPTVPIFHQGLALTNHDLLKAIRLLPSIGKMKNTLSTDQLSGAGCGRTGSVYESLLIINRYLKKDGIIHLTSSWHRAEINRILLHPRAGKRADKTPCCR